MTTGSANPLTQLLDAEARARDIIEHAQEARQHRLDETLGRIREAEARFDAGRASLRAPYLQEAQARADQAIAELTRQFDARQRALREMAARNEQAAIDATLKLMLEATD